MEKNRKDTKETRSVDEQPQGKAKNGRPKSAIGRWLNKLAKTNQKEFGSNGPTCCN